MTIVAANWVGENTSTLGTGPLALSGAISTFCPFSVIPDGSEVYYTLQEGFNRETGIGVVSNGTLTRNVQATLVAGVYTETDIPISLVGNGQVFAVINADFITRIYNFSLDVADSVAAAAASAQAAADSASLANDYETQSAQNAQDAAASAQSASDSKADANASKNAAAASATAAANSQAAALASQNAAKTSETNSKTSETNAAASKAAADNFAQSSVSAATNSANSAAAALASQNAAKTSETNAKTSETNSKASENAAATSQTDAANSKAAAAASQSDAANSKTNAANSATAAAASAELARQYQPNTALQLFTTFVNATTGNTLNDNLADGVYPVTADSPGAPLAVTGKVWVTHRGTTCQQTWEAQVAANSTDYARKFFRTGVDDGAGGITWGIWEEHVFMDLNKITKVLRGVDSTFTLGADGASPLDAVSLRQMQQAIAAVSSSGGINGVMSTFIGSVEWWQGNAANIPTGYVAPSGQLDKRSDYPEIWALINAGVLSSTTDATWNSDAAQRGKFSTGTVTTGANANFRWPDLNGAVSGTPTGVFLRGAYTGPDFVGSPGLMRGPAAPNIKGSFTNRRFQGDGDNIYAPFQTADGPAMSVRRKATGTLAWFGSPVSGGSCDVVQFDASNSSIVYGNGYTEIRPASVTGTWIMRAKGTFSAQTSFAVMLSVASNPANSSTTEGGKVRSTLVGPAGELGGVDVKYRHIVDASGNISKQMVLNVTGSAGEVRINENGSIDADGGLVVAGGMALTGNESINGNLTFATATQRRALVTHLGFTGATNRLVVPISATQAVQIISATTIGNQNSSGDSTITFPYSFASINSVILSNGDGAVGNLTLNILNAMRTGGFDCRIYNGSGPQVGSVRINYIAMGLINI